MNLFKELILPTIVLIIVTLGVFSIPIYYASCRGADVYNKLNGTSFTCGDFFWASNQINSQTQTIKIK